jgi:hypothetical protein
MNANANGFQDTCSRNELVFALLGRLDDVLGAYEPLIAEESRALPRLDKRCQAAVAEIAKVCRDFALEDAGAASIDEMVDRYQEATALRQQLEALDLVRARLDSRRRVVEADVARQVYFFYQLARNAARFDGALRDRLKPVIALFQTRKTRPRPLTPPPPTPPPRTSSPQSQT